MTTDYTGPVRLNKISNKDWLLFKEEFHANKFEKFKDLRLGQAFIIYKTVKGNTDPDLFYQENEETTEKIIYRHYIYDVPLSNADLKLLFETWFISQYGHAPKIDDVGVNTMYLTMFADGAFTGFKAGLLLKNSV